MVRWWALALVGVTLASPVPLRAETVRLPVTRDNWFSDVGPEADGNNGGSGRLKLKSIQEMSLIDVDTAPLRGRVVLGATLHVRAAAGPPLRRVTVSSFGAEWVEGTSNSYAPQKGSSSFRHARHPDVPWTVPGSDLCAVMLGQGGTVWRMADARPPDAAGWQTVAVDPAVVGARVAGVSYGFLLFDDTGSEWTRKGDAFHLQLFPNRFVYSREEGAARAPYLTVVLGPKDDTPPPAPGELRSVCDGLPAGEATVTWLTPTDAGAGVAGFQVRADGKEVPRYLIPVAGPAGGRVTMRLRDLGTAAGARVRLQVRAVDGAGNVGPPAEATVAVSAHRPFRIPEAGERPFEGVAPLPRLGEAEVAVLDELDKVHPVSGEMIPRQAAGYLAANHLWSARDGEVRLHAARNEFVAFQVHVAGPVKDLRPSLTIAGLPGVKASFGRYHLVGSKKGPLPDPVVPLAGGLTVPDPAVEGQRSAGLHCEVYVPHGTPAGAHTGELRLTAGAASLTLKVTLRVWDFTLPDTLSFLPEMNCYGLPAGERDYYRLAHAHRTVLNMVPYHHNGAVKEGCAPGWDGRRLDWSAWDRRFGPLLDGSAFADLPRKGVPLECFYLPLFENWPEPMEGNYNGDYWADRAFPDRYRRDFVEVSRQFAAHFDERDWNGTLFHCFFNGKNNFKAGGWSRGTSPWLLDEPANFQDYWALRYFGAAFHEGVNAARARSRMVFRCDISRPEWQRDALDGLLDYNVVGGAFRPYRRMVLDRKEANGEIVVEYGGTNAVESSNVQPLGWSLDTWSLGGDGVLPWQTVGDAAAWKNGDPLSLFYPGRGRGEGPVPSVRLKAYRRGQQDVEYLTLLGLVKGEPRWSVGAAAREALRLSGERKGTGFAGEDAGLIDYGRLLPRDVWALRVRVGRALSEVRPAAKRTLVEWRTPRRDPSKLPPALARTAESGR